jgi:mRNA interferase MazF
MIHYRPGDLVLVSFPFVSGAGAKSRPALIVMDTGDSDIVVARVTTQIHSTTHDVPIADWRGAGLLAPSTIRLHKLATLAKSLVNRTLGSLPPADRQNVKGALGQLFASW